MASSNRPRLASAAPSKYSDAADWITGVSKRSARNFPTRSDVPLEQFRSFGALAPDEVSVAKIVRCDHLDGAITEVARDGERLLPAFESCIVVASDSPLQHHEVGDLGEPVLIAERPGEHLRLLEVFSHPCPITAWVDRIKEIEV